MTIIFTELEIQYFLGFLIIIYNTPTVIKTKPNKSPPEQTVPILLTPAAIHPYSHAPHLPFSLLLLGHN